MAGEELADEPFEDEPDVDEEDVDEEAGEDEEDELAAASLLSFFGAEPSAPDSLPEDSGVLRESVR